MSSPITNSGGINFQAALASGDIQTIIQMVQSERVRLLDSQLVDQVKAVQSRNDQIAKLNNVLSELTKMQQFYGTEANETFLKDTSDAYGDKAGRTYEQFVQQYEAPLNKAIEDAGIADLGFPNNGNTGRVPSDGKGNFGQTFDQNGNIVKVTGSNVWGGNATKGQMDAAITKIKGLIDAESNNQQMDMLRLQSLNNKKNESIEILTNTQKKHTDANSNIIRNI
ncbi:MAG: hypothetical protein ACO2ER_10450 [Castellaniella sp.]